MSSIPAKSTDLESTAIENPSAGEVVSDSLALGVIFALSLTVVQRLIGFLRGVVFCRIMSDQQLGQWSMIWSCLMLLAPLAVLGLPGCFARFVEHYKQKGQAGTFVKRIAIISGVGTLLVSGLIMLFPGIFSWIVFRDSSQTSIMVCLAIALLVVSAMNFLTSLLESIRQVRMVTIMRFAQGAGFAVFAIAFMLLWSNSSAAATLGFAVGSFIAILPAVWFIRRFNLGLTDSGSVLTNMSMWRRIAPYAAWMWIANFFHNMFEVSDRYMLIHWSPVESSVAQGFVGQYHSGRVLPLLLVGIAAILANLVMPYMAASFESGKKEDVRKQLNSFIKLVSFGFTLVGVCILLAAPVLFNGILQGRYNDGLAVLPLTLVYCIWSGTFTVAQDYLWIAEKGKSVFVVVAVGLILNIALNMLLIPWFGLWGAVIATTIANSFNLALILIINSCYQCRPDMGCWICCLSPIVLVLPITSAASILAIVALLAVKTGWVIEPDEKTQIVAQLSKLKNKLLSR